MKNKKRIIAIICVAIALIVASGVAAYFWWRNKSEPVTEQTGRQTSQASSSQPETKTTENSELEENTETKPAENQSSSKTNPAKPSTTIPAQPSTSNPAPTTPTTPATPTPNPQPTNITWYSADFETGDLSQWYNNQSCPGAITVVNDPVRAGNYAAKFSVTDNDTSANCPKSPTLDPRAQLIASYRLKEGDDVFIGLSTFFPADFPNITEWLGISQIYGPPYGGSPTMGLGVKGDRLQFSAYYDGKHHTVWTSQPIRKGTNWEDIVLHLKLSPDRTVGFVELWHNGARQTLLGGATRYNYPTLVEGLNWTGTGGENYLYAQQYRSRTAKLGTVVLYHDNFKIGTTYQSVAP